MTTMPAWERNLTRAVAARDLIVAIDKVIGRVSPEYVEAEARVTQTIDTALALGASQASVDIVLERLRGAALALDPVAKTAAANGRTPELVAASLRAMPNYPRGDEKR